MHSVCPACGYRKWVQGDLFFFSSTVSLGFIFRKSMEVHFNKAIQVLKTIRLPELDLGAPENMGFQKIPKAVPFTASPCKYLHCG